MPRHFLVVFLSFYAEFSLAAANDWNCEKNEAGEWSCVTQLPEAKPQTPAAPKTVKPAPQTAVKTAPKSEVVEKKHDSLPLENKSEPLPNVETVENNNNALTDSKIAEKKPESLPKSSPVTTDAAPINATVSAPVTPVNAAADALITAKPVAVKSKNKSQASEPVAVPEIQLAQNPVPMPLSPPPNVVSSSQEGWTCTPNQENSTWDCRLVGANPKGEAKIMADEDDHSFRILDPAFNPKQERAFQNLKKEFKSDPWQQCYMPNAPKPVKIKSNKELREKSPLEIEADYSEVFDKHINNFTGSVEMHRADQHLTADAASYDSAHNLMDTQGDVYYSEDGLALFSNTANLKMADDKAVLRDVLFESLTGPFRGSAAVAYKDSKDLSHYKEVAYTSCAPGNQDWVMHSGRLKLNKDSGTGTSTNAWIEFKGVPVIYTPYIDFPIDDRRKSGFLSPTWGRTARSGFQLNTPFYWNIAPNYDAVLKPRYLQKRGLLLGVDGRYLTEMSKGSVGVEYMPYDNLRQISRYSGYLKNQTTFLPNLTTDADLNYVSDKDYFYELGNALNFNNTRYVTSRANLNYSLPGLTFSAMFQHYQTIDSTIPQASRPYQILPQITLNFNHSFESLPIELAMDNAFANFSRPSTVNGQRFNTKPSIALPLGDSSAFIKPKLSLQYTQYLLNNQTPGLPANVRRTLPIASLDTGAIFEQDFKSDDNTFRHTLEPRAFYLYVPRANQDLLPVFDTALYDLNLSSLFRENRYSGSDRVQDANQLSLALTSRLQNVQSGQEYIKLGVGGIVYFNDRTVTLPGYAPQTTRLSNIIAELTGTLNEHFSYSSGIQWNPHLNQLRRANAALQFTNQTNQVINIGFLYRKEHVGETVPVGYIDPRSGLAATNGDVISIAQSDVSFRWPVYDDWYLMGRWLYALNFNQTKESFIGVEKDSCCWRFSIIGRRYSNALSTTVTSQLQTGIFVQLELKGLGSFGDQVDQFLQNNIPGYSKANKNN